MRIQIPLRERILQRLETGPFGQQIIAEAEKAEHEERKRLRAKIAARRAAFERERKPLEGRAQAAGEAYQQALTALKTAAESTASAHAERRSCDLRFERETAALERELEALAPHEQIRAFVAELDEHLARVIAAGWDSVVGPALVDGSRAWVFTNRESYESVLSSIRDARRRSLALPSNADVENFDAALGAIRASIPAVEPVRIPRKFRGDVPDGHHARVEFV